jgi:hypothetical protein
LNVLSAICSVILDDFSAYYNQFMPMMTEILQNVGSDTLEGKKLRAKTLDTIGSIIIAVSDCEDKAPFQASITEITGFCCQMLQTGFSDDDPQSEAVKDALTQSAGFLGADFAQFMPLLLNQLLADAQLEIDFKMESADMPNTTGNTGL